MLPTTKSWFPYVKPGPTSSLRLFCFPYGGGSASVFRSWTTLWPGRIEVWGAQPPGRETRFADAPFTRLEPWVSALADAITPLLDRPFAFFGHSLGGLVAFELTRELRRRRLPLPLHLIVSATRAPQTSWRRDLHALSESEMMAFLRRLETAPELLASPDLLSLLLPILRKDLEALSHYEYREEAPLDIPLRAFAGTRDVEYPPSEIRRWESMSRDFKGLREFPGGHFFLNTERDAVHAAIREDLTPYVQPSAAVSR